MQILGLLGMYFDAVVVEVEKYLLFSDWLWPYCVGKGRKKTNHKIRKICYPSSFVIGP